MRNRPGSAPTSSTYGRRGAGAITVSPTPGPRTASSSPAVSRTVRLTHSSTPSPTSAREGPTVIRPWLGLSPTTPQHDAGMRMLPPPSEALANGTIPAATAAAAPPLDPPGVRSSAHGFRVAPQATGCVVGRLPISGLLVRPAMTSPAALNRATSVVSAASILPASLSATLPFERVWPAKLVYRSLSKNGTPRNGPLGRSGSAATDRACSNHSMTTAFNVGFDCSIRSIAASNSSLGVTSSLATSAAWSVASIQRVSSARPLMAFGLPRHRSRGTHRTALGSVVGGLSRGLVKSVIKGFECLDTELQYSRRPLV